MIQTKGNPTSWDLFYVRMAMLVATKSKDRSTKVGAVVTRNNDLLTMGFNDLPRGIYDGESQAYPMAFNLGGHSVMTEGPSIQDVYDAEKELTRRREEKPYKYLWHEHAERNAVFNAARTGISLLGATLYQNWQPTSCTDCARAIIQAGITTCIGPDIPFGGKGKGMHYDVDHVGEMLLDEAGIERWKIPVELFE